MSFAELEARAARNPNSPAEDDTGEKSGDGATREMS